MCLLEDFSKLLVTNKKTASPRVVRGFNSKNHEVLMKIVYLKNCIDLIYSRGWQKGPPPGTLRVNGQTLSTLLTSSICF